MIAADVGTRESLRCRFNVSAVPGPTGWSADFARGTVLRLDDDKVVVPRW